MELIYQDNTWELPVEDDSYSYEAVMALRELTLHFHLPEYVEYPTGAYCDFNGKRWFLNKPAKFTKNGTRNFNYTHDPIGA